MPFFNDIHNSRFTTFNDKTNIIIINCLKNFCVLCFDEWDITILAEQISQQRRPKKTQKTNWELSYFFMGFCLLWIYVCIRFSSFAVFSGKMVWPNENVEYNMTSVAP